MSRSSGQVTHVLLTRSRLCPRPKPGSSLHLHVLGTPQAFVLSQDQTLRERVSSHPRARLESRSRGSSVTQSVTLSSDARTQGAPDVDGDLLHRPWLERPQSGCPHPDGSNLDAFRLSPERTCCLVFKDRAPSRAPSRWFLAKQRPLGLRGPLSSRCVRRSVVDVSYPRAFSSFRCLLEATSKYSAVSRLACARGRP